MTEDEFVEAVMRRIPECPEDSVDAFRATTRDHFRRGFSFEDVVRLHRLTEEINPDLSEEVGLRRMKVILDKYPRR
jgi:hypothetical protein